MTLFAEKKQRHKYREQMYRQQGGKRVWNELEDWDQCIHLIDTMYKIDN